MSDGTANYVTDLDLGEVSDLPVVAGCGCCGCATAGSSGASAADTVGYLASAGNSFVAGQASNWRWTSTDDQGRIDISYAFATSTSDLTYANANAGTVFSSGVIASSGAHVRFGVTSNPTTLEGHAADLKADTEVAFAMLENVAAMTFTESESGFQSAETDFKILAFDALSYNSGGLNGRATFPGSDLTGSVTDPYEAYQIYDVSRSSMVTDPELGGATNRLHVALHETMHSLGVYHPHESFGWTGNGNTASGDNVLDNDRYTVMSYERGGLDQNTQWLSYGYSATPMVIDIAILQHLYGSTANHTGDTVYTLTDAGTVAADFDGDDGAVSIGRAFYAITDTGGTDTIQYSGAKHALLNLNNATLDQTGDSAEIAAILTTLQASAHFNALLPVATASELRNDLLEAEWHAGGFGSRIFDDAGAADLGGYYIAADDFADAAHITRLEHATGSAQADILIGNDLGNHLRGNGDDDLMIGGGGADTLHGGAGSEELFGGTGGDLIAPHGGADTVDGGAGDDTLTLSDDTDLGAGDVLEGGADTDTLTLGTTGTGAAYRLDLATMTGIEVLDFQSSTAGITGQILASQMGPVTTLRMPTGAVAGLSIDMAGQTTLDLSGLDTASLETAHHSLALLGSSATQALDLTGTSHADSITGGSNADRLIGGGGADSLDGGAGADTLEGGAGDDTYHIDDLGDFVRESADDGTDHVIASVDVALKTFSQALETLTLVGSADLQGIGNARDNTLTGNDGANLLNGALGNDTLIGGAGADEFDDDGGADHMVGGPGDDIYRVDDAADTVSEAAGEGEDRIIATVSYVLGAAVEHLTLMGKQPLTGTGNDLDNILFGNSGDNILDGGSGADVMRGGAGNDLFRVEDAGDRVAENADAGQDTVEAAVSFALRDHSKALEDLVLVGAADLVGTGNAGANQITGNSGANTLNGALGDDTLIGGAGADVFADDHGADRMEGGAGNDIYDLDDARDQIIEAAGDAQDRVIVSIAAKIWEYSQEVEDITVATHRAVMGNAQANAMDGDAGPNRLLGAKGDDTLDGGAGLDVLTGNKGADTFVLATTTTEADRITDFEPGTDQLRIVTGATGAVPLQAFVEGGAATLPAHRVLYDAATGALSYDEDGSGPGAPVLLATLDHAPTLSASDLVWG